MKEVGMDLGKRQSHVCVKDECENVLDRSRIRTTRSALARASANREPCEMLTEPCRDARWVHEHLTALGHKVLVIETTPSRMIGVRLGKRNTDRRDAEALPHALVAEQMPEAYVLGKGERRSRGLLHARRQLVRTRTRLLTTMRGQF